MRKKSLVILTLKVSSLNLAYIAKFLWVMGDHVKWLNLI